MMKQHKRNIELSSRTKKKSRVASDSLSQNFELGIDMLRESFVQLKQQNRIAKKTIQNLGKWKENISSLENQLLHAHSKIDKLKRQILKEKEKSKELENRNHELTAKYREGEIFRENLFRMIQKQENQFKSSSSIFSENNNCESKKMKMSIHDINISNIDNTKIRENKNTVKLKSKERKKKRILLPEPNVEELENLENSSSSSNNNNENLSQKNNISSCSSNNSLDEEDEDDADDENENENEEKLSEISNLRKQVRKNNLLEEVQSTSCSPVISPINNRKKIKNGKNEKFEIFGKENNNSEILENQNQLEEEEDVDVDLKLDVESDYNESDDGDIDSLDENMKDLTRNLITPADLSSLYSSQSIKSPKKRMTETRYCRNQGRLKMGNSEVGRNSITEAEELYAKVKNKLSTSQFRHFADNIKKLNSEELSQEQTLRNIRKIFGSEKFDLYIELERLVKNKE